jgi:hypothetical protein
MTALIKKWMENVFPWLCPTSTIMIFKPTIRSEVTGTCLSILAAKCKPEGKNGQWGISLVPANILVEAGSIKE